jgi:uncharacterized protein YcbK (DUF882 family)
MRPTLAVISCLIGCLGGQGVIAFGETRTLSFVHTHTNETATITFRRNGQYDQQALNELNWLLRDWRVNEPAKMDPRLFDIIWEVHREAGSRGPVHIISAYRSPATNSMLRNRSRGVSEHSQHMSGRAMDIRLPDVDTARLRAVAMRLQYGGVGYYASGFVHLDTGSVRAWPRMSQEQLARLFPNGKTLHLPADGKPLPGYEEARSEIPARNAALAQHASASAGSSAVSSLLSKLFGRGDREQAQEDRLASVRGAGVIEPVQDDPRIASPPLAPLPPRRPEELVMLGREEARTAPVLAEAIPATSLAGPDWGVEALHHDDVATLFVRTPIAFVSIPEHRARARLMQ